MSNKTKGVSILIFMALMFMSLLSYYVFYETNHNLLESFGIVSIVFIVTPIIIYVFVSIIIYALELLE